jgi:Cu/Ag efflux pump CusA
VLNNKQHSFVQELRVNLMINDDKVIDNLDDLEAFLISVESGLLGLQNVAGVAMATQNSTGRHFVAVLDDKHQLLLGRWVTEEVFNTGQELVRNGPKRPH